MIIKKCVSLITLTLLIAGCAAPKLMKKSDDSEKGSAVLFYKQADKADPFLDSLITNPADSASIKALLLPPPPPPPPVQQAGDQGGGIVPPRPPAECTWEEFLEDPYRCRYAKIIDPPTVDELREIAPQNTPAAKLAALAMALRIIDGDTFDAIAGLMALRLNDDSSD